MKNIFKRADIIVFSVLVLALIFALLIITVSKDFGSYVLVSVDGQTVEQFPLNKDGEYIVNGGTNTVVVKDSKVWVTDASCPDKLCEKMGAVQYSGQSIICLPNKLTVEITGSEDLDFII